MARESPDIYYRDAYELLADFVRIPSSFGRKDTELRTLDVGTGIRVKKMSPSLSNQ